MQITNFFKSVDNGQINLNSDLPDAMGLNRIDSVIVIGDDSSPQKNSQTEPKVITLSDSDSECLSLPDLEEPFDIYPCSTQSHVPNSNDITQESFSWNFNVSSTNGDIKLLARDSPNCFPHSETKKQDTQSFICISDDSFDSDLIELTSGDEDFKTTLNCYEETNESSFKDVGESPLIYTENSCSKKVNSWLDNSDKHFLKDTCQSTNKDNQGASGCFSALNSKQSNINNSFSLSNFVGHVLPYSLQSYSSNTNLGIEDLEDQPLVTAELIRSCLEEGKSFALCTADIACQYLYAYRPMQNLLKDLVKWFQQRDIGFTLENEGLLQLPYFKLYGLFNELFYRYPENVFILWDALHVSMFRNPLEESAFLNFALILEIYLSVLEGEFFWLQDPQKCQVYRFVANNESYSNIKKIIQWVNQAVEILNEKKLILPERVLCQLGKLLELGVVVSLRNNMLAKRIAQDLIGIYLSIRSLNARQCFLSTIQSSLIRFKLLEILLEKHCGGTILSWSFMPENIADIAKSFFQATPIENNLLDDDNTVISLDGLKSMSPSRWEELIMLIYSSIISYLDYFQGKRLSFYFQSNVMICTYLTQKGHTALHVGCTNSHLQGDFCACAHLSLCTYL